MPPKKIRIAINGYGRIGRCTHRQILGVKDIEVVAVNSRAPAEMHAHLLKYDSIYGTLPDEIKAGDDSFTVDGHKIAVFTGEPGQDFSWGELGVDVVIEATGRLTNYPDAEKHLRAGARKVLVTAPCRDIRIPTFVMGVNDADYDSADQIVSNASCTTNCLAPVLKVLDENFGLRSGHLTAVHSVTGDQTIHDNSHSDFRRARSFLPSIIPTKTGVSAALARVLPSVSRKITGVSLRVPTLIVSLIDLVAELEQEVTVAQINSAFEKDGQKNLQGILSVCREPLVSVDFRGDSHSAIIDAENTSVLDGHLAKIFAWYDNEWGYSARVIDLIRLIG